MIDGGVLARGGSAVLVLAGPAPTAVDGSTARWRLDLEAGESIAFALQYSTTSDPRPQPWPPQEVQRRLTATCEG